MIIVIQFFDQEKYSLDRRVSSVGINNGMFEIICEESVERIDFSQDTII